MSIKMNMKLKYRLFVITMIIMATMFSLVLTGCGDKFAQTQTSSDDTGVSVEQTAATEQTDPAEQTSGQSTTAQDAAANKFPLEVTDAGGFKMTIASEPRRIISLTLGSDEMLIGLVDVSRIIALTTYADDAELSNVSAEAAGVAERASMSKIENIIALKPDLVITDTWTDPNEVQQLRDTGITVYVFKTPNNIDEQKAVIAELANVVGADEKGVEIMEWMDSKLKYVEDRLADLKHEDKLTILDYGEMGTSGIGTNFDDIVTRAGLINAASKAGLEGWPFISKEKIIELNPDIISLPSWYYDKSNSLQGMINTLKGDASLQTVKAVKNNRFIAVPNKHISAISQYVVLAVEDVAREAYPELFKE